MKIILMNKGVEVLSGFFYSYYGAAEKAFNNNISFDNYKIITM